MSCEIEFPIRKVTTLMKQSRNYEANGDLVKALRCMDKIRGITKVTDLVEEEKLTKRIASICNVLYSSSSAKVPYLRKAENAILSYISLCKKNKISLDEELLQISMITFNNWAMFHKSGGNYDIALNYFAKALDMEKDHRLKDPDSYELLAKTKLNIGILYSEIKQYADSIACSQECLEILQEEHKIRTTDQTFEELGSEERKKFEDMISTYILAFYSISLAHEALGHYNEMKEALENAVNIGDHYLVSSNQVYTTVQRSLMELEKKKSYANMNKQNILKNRPRSSQSKANGNHARPRISQISLSVPSSDVKIIVEHEKTSKNSGEIKLPGRYYTRKELVMKTQRLDSESKFNFISADKFFFQEISKNIDINSDIKHLKRTASNDPKNILREETSEKRVLSDLRLKKNYRTHLSTPEIPVIKQTIQMLKQTDQELSSRQQRKLNSVINSPKCKNLIKLICDTKHKTYYPAQSMF